MSMAFETRDFRYFRASLRASNQILDQAGFGLTFSGLGSNFSADTNKPVPITQQIAQRHLTKFSANG